MTTQIQVEDRNTLYTRSLGSASLAFFWIPGLGPILVAGPLVSWIVGALEGAISIGGLSAVGAGLYSLGIPKDSILRYETALKNDKFVVIVHGSMYDTTHAQEILDRTQPETLEQHPVTGNSRSC